MIDEQLKQELKQKLLEEQKKLEDELSKIAKKEDDNEYEAKFEDFGRSEEDNAEEVENYAANLSITETLERNLEDVNDALKRMDAGDYGICEQCKEKEIKIERLKAYPAARKCMTCAENR